MGTKVDMVRKKSQSELQILSLTKTTSVTTPGERDGMSGTRRALALPGEIPTWRGCCLHVRHPHARVPAFRGDEKSVPRTLVW